MAAGCSTNSVTNRSMLSLVTLGPDSPHYEERNANGGRDRPSASSGAKSVGTARARAHRCQDPSAATAGAPGLDLVGGPAGAGRGRVLAMAQAQDVFAQRRHVREGYGEKGRGK